MDEANARHKSVHSFFESRPTVRLHKHLNSRFTFGHEEYTGLTSLDVSQTWFTKVVQGYEETTKAMEKRFPRCRRPSAHLPFAGMTLNTGPTTVVEAHRDSNNRVDGVCFTTGLGPFDHEKGGHLVLHEPQLIIELPPGYTLAFPSACITHEGLPISHEEARMSFTAYSAGALFRYEENDFQPQAKRQKIAEVERVRVGNERWVHGWGLYNKLVDGVLVQPT